MVAVFFGDDALRSETEAMLLSYGCTAAWRDAVSEYGVGDAVYERSVVIPEFPSVQGQHEFEDWMRQRHSSLGLVSGPDAPVFVFFVPEGASVSEQPCKREQGYHSAISLDEQDPERHGVAYAVVERCPLDAWMTPLDQRAHITSHELLEMTIDPYPATDAAWRGLGGAPIQIELALDDADENADLCGNVFETPDQYPLPIASGWSNRRASAGLNPCTSDAQAFVVAYPSVTSVDLSSGTSEFDVDYYSDVAGLQLTTSALLFSISSRCVSIDGFMPAKGDPDLEVTDGVTLHVSLSAHPTGECVGFGIDAPRLLISAGAKGMAVPWNVSVAVTGLP